MVIKLNLQNMFLRVLFGLGFIVFLWFLSRIVYKQYIIGSLSENAAIVDKTGLLSAVGDFPDSGRLFAKLAETEIKQPSPDLETVERNAQNAINLSPNNYKYRLLLGEIRIARSHPDGAEAAINDALTLAPNNYDAHWRLANLQIGEGKTEAAIEHFRIAIGFNPSLLSKALELVWPVSDQNIPALAQIVNNSPTAQLKLALFLLGKSRVSDAVDAFAKIDKDSIISSTDLTSFLDTLAQKGFFKISYEIWLQRKGTLNSNVNQPAVWNGDFETALSSDLKQFDWQIDKSEYARIGIDSKRAHSGIHSLLINFYGRDTTRLDNEIRQLIVLRPGATYRLSFFVRAENFHTPNEGPFVAAAYSSADNLEKWVAKSKPISVENTDWLQMSFDFITPRNAVNGAPITISIKRQPRYSYDEPTTGKLWFDDFLVTEVRAK